MNSNVGSERVEEALKCLDVVDIFDQTTVLLTAVETGSISKMCVDKCLEVLIRCLSYSSVLKSNNGIVPDPLTSVARRCLEVTTAVTPGDKSADQPVNSNESSAFVKGWVSNSITRTGSLQGFGGYPLRAEEEICNITHSVEDCCGETDVVISRHSSRGNLSRYNEISMTHFDGVKICPNQCETDTAEICEVSLKSVRKFVLLMLNSAAVLCRSTLARGYLI